MAGWDLAIDDKAPVQQIAPLIPQIQPPANPPKWPGMTPGATANIGVMIPHRSEFDYRVWKEWWDMCPKPAGMMRFEERGFSLTTARTHLVKQAMENKGLTHLMFLDDDVVPPNTIFQDLVNVNSPLACGIYMSKKKKGERGLAAWNRHPQGLGYAPIAFNQPMRYIQVDVTGLGIAMIHRWVFENLPEPWFEWNVPGPSEDFYFFEKCFKVLGIKPIIDLGSQCQHIGTWSMDCTGEVDAPAM